MSDQVKCFGLFMEGHPQCLVCNMRRRCKSVTLSEGFDAVGAMVEHMTAELPEGDYQDTDRVTELVELLVRGPDPAEELIPGMNVTPEEVTAELI